MSVKYFSFTWVTTIRSCHRLMQMFVSHQICIGQIEITGSFVSSPYAVTCWWSLVHWQELCHIVVSVICPGLWNISGRVVPGLHLCVPCGWHRRLASIYPQWLYIMILASVLCSWLSVHHSLVLPLSDSKNPDLAHLGT